MESEFLSEQQVWVLEDDEGCRFIYSEALELRYDLKFFETVGAFREAFRTCEEPPKMIIADLKLPGESFLRFLSQEEDLALLERIPFIIVSSIDDIDVLKKCFDDGAVDYMTKPFGKSELIVKIERILKGDNNMANQIVAMDSTKLLAGNEEGQVKLTPKEMQILSVLRQRGGEPVPRELIVKRVWDKTTVGSKTLDVHLFNLRRKTKSLGIKIRFVPPDSLQLLGDGVDE